MPDALHAPPYTVPVVRTGSGRPVLFVHGTADSPLAWGRVLRALPDVEALALDLPAATGPDPGGEATPPGALLDGRHSCLPRDRDALIAVARSLGSPALVAHSYGGLVALRAAMQAPSAFSTLVLIEPIAFGVLRQEQPGAMEALDAALARHFDDFVQDPERALPVLVDYWNGPGAWAALPPRLRQLLGRGGRRARAEVVAGHVDRTDRAALAALARSGPRVAVVRGAGTTAQSFQLSGSLARAMGAATATIDGAGHTPMRDQPEKCAALLRDLLQVAAAR